MAAPGHAVSRSFGQSGAELNDASDTQDNRHEEAAAETTAASPNPQPFFDPRRRLRELLAIPERDRTDAEWDEINELEIQLAPGNRIGNAPHFALPGNKPAGGANKNRFRKLRKGGKVKQPAKPPRP